MEAIDSKTLDQLETKYRSELNFEENEMDRMDGVNTAHVGGDTSSDVTIEQRIFYRCDQVVRSANNCKMEAGVKTRRPAASHEASATRKIEAHRISLYSFACFRFVHYCRGIYAFASVSGSEKETRRSNDGGLVGSGDSDTIQAMFQFQDSFVSPFGLPRNGEMFWNSVPPFDSDWIN